jgi:hypothetical protein
VAQVEFYPLVLALREAVRLRMKCRRHVLLDAELLGQSLSEVGRESGVSVGYDLVRQSEPSIDILEVQTGYSFPRYRGGTWEEQCRSGAAVIDDSEDGIVAFTFG